MTDRSPAIALDDIRLTLPSDAGPVNILNGISLSVEAGETIGVVGPSGSGKTSLLMVIAGLERQSGGKILVAGHDLGIMDEDRLAAFRRDHIGVVFQNFHLVPTMTALENVAVPLELAGRPDAFSRAEAELAAVDLGHRLFHYPAQLSGGEQQRVALARAFAPEPAILLADEPTGNLDRATGATVMDVLFDLHTRKGTTLLLVTHAPELVDRCNRAIQIADGRVVEDRRISSISAMRAGTRT